MVHVSIITIIIIIIIISRSTGPSGKNKVVYKLLSQPHKHLRYGKLNKTKLMEATYGWLRLWTHPAFRCQTQCREGHSTFEPGPTGNTLKIGRFYKLILQNFNGWATAAQVYLTLVEADGSSLNRQWLEFAFNLVQHTKPSSTTLMTQRQETLIRAKPDHKIDLTLKKLKVTFSSWPPLRRAILKDWENKWKIAMK